MRARPVLAAAVAAAALLASTATAAAKPQLEDPAGDQLPGASGDYDIVSALFEATKKDGKVKDLVITLGTSSAPTLGGAPSYNMRGDVSGCGTFLLYVFTSAEAGTSSTFQTNGCGNDTDTTGEPAQYVDVTDVVVKGTSVVFTIPVNAMPTEIKKATFSNLFAWSAPAEPIIGYTPAEFVPQTAFDSGTGTGSFKMPQS